MRVSGRCSWFGGPLDRGVAPDEGLALISSYEQAPHLFLEKQPIGTTGLARRLNPNASFIACRWDYDEMSKQDIVKTFAMVRARKTNHVIIAFPVDWGPHESTGRVADISLGAMRRLGIMTDDEVDVAFPASEGLAA